MKKVLLILIAAGVAGVLASVSAQPAPGGDTGNAQQPADQPGPPPEMGGGPEGGGPPPDLAPGAEAPGAPADQTAKTPMVIIPSRAGATAPQLYASRFLPPAGGTNSIYNTNDITLIFANAALSEILNYLSDAAGFIVVQEARISSSVKVTVSGKHLTQSEAADLLNSVLNQNGFAAIRDGRVLTIVDKNEAKTREIPVKSGNNPDAIPRNAEIVTQIIPIRFVEARQLVSDLSSFVSPQATVVANEAGNSIVITDTQANIHHLAEIIRAVDDSAEAETEIRVFPLEHANPSDVATELASVFPSSSSGSTSQSPIRFGGGPGGGGPGGFFARMMANAGGASSSSSNDRIKKATQVTAVADLRTSSVIVSAPKDLMQEIANMMKELDVVSSRDQDVFVYKLNNGDPQQVAQVLQNMFQTSSSRSTTGSSQNSALQQRTQNSTQQMSSQSTSSGFGSSGSGGGGRTGATP